MSDHSASFLLRAARGQPECSRALVSAGRSRTEKGLVLGLVDGTEYVVHSCAPLYAGARWVVLMRDSTLCLNPADPRIVSVGRQA